MKNDGWCCHILCNSNYFSILSVGDGCVCAHALFYVIIPKTQNNSRHVSCRMQRSIDQSEHVFLKKYMYPVHVISVAVIRAVVQQNILLLAFVVL